MANYTNGQNVAKMSAMEEGQRTILRELRRLADRFDYAFGKAPRPRPEEPEEDQPRHN